MQRDPRKQKIIIAIDGFSSCGKSTVAKALAAKLGYTYIDTGAMYRAVTFYILEHNVNINNPPDITTVLHNIQIEFRREEGINQTYLNGRNVEKDIRSMRVSNAVSEVSAIPAIREHVVALQQDMGATKGIVMEGRDIGTVVFPEAELKIFLTAQPEIRVERRYLEMKAKGKNITREAVRKNLEMRDLIDSTRAHSPLRRASDAWILDNSDMTVQEQVDIISRKAASIIEDDSSN